MRVWKWGSAWTRRGADIEGEAYDSAGYSVAISEDGSVVAVGAILNDGGGVKNTGQVSVHEWNGDSDSWARRGDDIHGPMAGDESGYSVSLSADARYLAIGAPKSDKGGADAGEVRVFEWDDSAYAQRGKTITGDAVLDRLGWAVSLSGDGDVLACGMPHSDRGRARVLAWDGTTYLSGVRFVVVVAAAARSTRVQVHRPGRRHIRRVDERLRRLGGLPVERRPLRGRRLPQERRRRRQRRARARLLRGGGAEADPGANGHADRGSDVDADHGAAVRRRRDQEVDEEGRELRGQRQVDQEKQKRRL